MGERSKANKGGLLRDDPSVVPMPGGRGVSDAPSSRKTMHDSFLSTRLPNYASVTTLSACNNVG